MPYTFRVANTGSNFSAGSRSNFSTGSRSKFSAGSRSNFSAGSNCIGVDEFSDNYVLGKPSLSVLRSIARVVRTWCANVVILILTLRNIIRNRLF